MRDPDDVDDSLAACRKNSSRARSTPVESGVHNQCQAASKSGAAPANASRSSRKSFSAMLESSAGLFTRPVAPRDLRTTSASLFGAIGPATGQAAGLVLSWADTEAMNAHLAVIAATVTPGAYALLLLDQAGWHTTAALDVPANITLLPLPPRAPELNPVENVWQYLRESWLSNRLFHTEDDMLKHCAHAC